MVVGPDAAPWVTDGGLNAIVRVDPSTGALRWFPVPRPGADLNTLTFDGRGMLHFTGQDGVYGKVDPAGGVDVYEAPRGRGPYGIATTPDGTPWFSSLAGSYIARVDPATARLDLVETATPGAGARRVWSDSSGGLWVSEWFAGNLGRYDPRARQWKEWKLPKTQPQPYAVYVDVEDTVWAPTSPRTPS